MTDERDDIAVERLFAASRASTPAPKAEFMARLMSDVESHVPVREHAPEPKSAFGDFWRRFEVWGGFAALASTAATGVWIGVALPETMDLPGADLFGISSDVSSLIPSYGSDVLALE